MSRFFYGFLAAVSIWRILKHYTIKLQTPFSFLFLSGGKNILKIYLQKFADIKYLLIFVEQ
jgi:hypothetical protein